MNLLIAFIADAYSEIVSKKDSSFSYEQANLMYFFYFIEIFIIFLIIILVMKLIEH